MIKIADVKWIKITTDIFDDEKILLIESLPDADAIIVIWFKLLCLAGKMNNSGVFMLNDRIPITEKMLATIFRRKELTVELALKTFQDFGMIEIIDDVITIPKWGKHQNLDQIEKRRDYMKEYMRKKREEQKGLIEDKVNSKVNSKVNVNPLDKIREDKDKIREDNTEERNDNVSSTLRCKEVVELYHKRCPSFPKVRRITKKRTDAIKARLRTYGIDEIKECFTKAEKSRFLKGGNDRNWTADFDWLMKESNMAKVLEGKYDDREVKPTVKPVKNKFNDFDQRTYDYEDLEKKLHARVRQNVRHMP